MRLLLDTHAALWWLADPDRLGADAQRRLSDRTNPILISAAVVWEVAIKRSLGKLTAPDECHPLLLQGARAHALPVRVEHAAATERLPWHHRDPFDRLLVAQALVEDAALVSGDAALHPYGAAIVW